nr:E-beta-farnesene synthase [Tanacetum cinerariifolium]
YLRHLKESVEMIRDIVEEAKVVRPLDRSIVSACRYTKHSQELLEYAIGTCPQGSQPRAKQLAYIPLIRKKQIIVAQPSNKLDSTTYLHVVTVKSQKTNVHVPPSTGVNSCPIAGGSQPKSHVKPNRISPAKGDNMLPVDDQPRKIKSHLRTSNHKMADVNASSGQTPTMAPLVRADDQILPYIRWVPIGKSNCYLDLEKSQSNPIYKIAVDLLKNTNFIRAFTASSTIPSIYIRQFWDTILYDKKAGCYRCQLDEQWFDLTKETLREALQITPVNHNQAFAAPPSIDRLIDFVNQLGYQKKHRFHPRPDSLLHLSNEEPVLGYLKFCAKGTKSEVFGMPIADSLITVEIRQATYYQEYLAKVTHHRNYLAGETGGVQNPPTPRPTQSSRKPKAPTRPSISIPVTSTQPAPTSAPAKSQEYKRKQATKTTDKPAKAKRFKRSSSRKTRQPRSFPKSMGASEAEEIPAEEPQVADEDADYLKAVEESMKDAYALPKGLLLPVVIRKPESRKYQPLPEVPGKGKAKVTEEQVAHDLLSLQKHKKTSPEDRYIFQRRVSKPTEYSFHDESPYDVLGQSDSEEESKKVVLGAEEGGQDKGQAGPDPDAQAEDQTGSDAGAQAEGQAGSNPDETSEGQAGSNPDETSKGQAGPDPGDDEANVKSISSHMVHVGSDHEHMDLDVADVSPQPSTEQLDEGFTATVYPNVQENLKLAIEEPVLLEEPVSSSGTLSSLQHLSRDLSFRDQFFSDKHSDPDKNKETEVELTVNVTIQQALSSISIMTSPIIDLTSRPESPKEHQRLKATTTDTTTITTTLTLPPPQAPQQNTTEAMMVKRIGELEHIMADLIQANKDMEERLDSHGARLFTLEQLDIPQRVGIAVSEVVTDAIDWAMQAPLRNRFRDLPEADMKEILHERMWESDSYKSHEDHIQLFDAREKSMNRDHSKELVQDLAEARKKKKKSPSGASGTPGASGSQVTPPYHRLHYIHQSRQSIQRLCCTKSLKDDLNMDEAVGPDEQAQVSDDEDIGSAHIPTMKAAYYPDAGLEQMVPDQFWIKEECKYDIAAIVVRIEVFSMYGYNYMKKIVLRRADLNEHVITERDFKYLYPSEFEDLNLLNLQGHLNHLPPKDKKILTTAVNQWTRQLVIRQRVEDFQLRIESY